MTRRQALAAYRPVRAAIQSVLREAVRACTRADIIRAQRQILPGADTVPEDDQTFEMLMDVALFEPNQRGRRPYDSFLAGKSAAQLDPPARAMAQLMAGARFSIFRVAGKHPAAGVWLEDLLAGEVRLWLLDQGLEASAKPGTVIGLRLFDVGPFQAGFGIIVQPDAETVDLCRAAAARGQATPFRHALAPALYGDALRERLPLDAVAPALEEVLGALASMAAALEAKPPAPRRTPPPGPAAPRAPRRRASPRGRE